MAGFINNSGAGGMTKELLWSNSSPTSSYSSGSATISAADYELFLIKYKFTYTDSYYNTQIAFKGEGLLQEVTIQSDGCYSDERGYTITDTKITWNTCTAYTYDGNNSTTTKYVIPIALYGLK